MVTTSPQKLSGSYYTPEATARSLVQWVVRSTTDRMLDPACGDGEFLRCHRQSVGVEQAPSAAANAVNRAPGALVHEGDFFTWATETRDRFDCAAGNPPFIRYQRFCGDVRERAIRRCRDLGVTLTSLCSSWTPFIVVAASLLKPGGRMAFVVPAEIGHAPYAKPLLKYLLDSFQRVHVVALREKLFPTLSEDCWLLYAQGFGEPARGLVFSALDGFQATSSPPDGGTLIPRSELERWSWRLRPFLVDSSTRSLYLSTADSHRCVRLGDIARVGIGYVTGANDFFHLRPTQAQELGISESFLHPAVRNGRMLQSTAITKLTVAAWRRRDEPMLLLKLDSATRITAPVRRYLESESGEVARRTYKCRSRSPWYAVPDVCIPDAFLSYMSGESPMLASNPAGCTCTNSVHGVHLNGKLPLARLVRAWSDPIVLLSCEIEGHPLGGGMLKLEPGEAARIAIPTQPTGLLARDLDQGTHALRRWRHHG